MIRNIREILPVDLLHSYDSLHSLRQSKDEWRYIFLDDGKFQDLANKNATQAAEIYWKEMLYRTHIVCLVSSFKTLRWIEALDSTFENYYGFCVSLRGLIESCADTFYTLQSTPLTFARDFFAIKEQINRRSRVFTTHAPLEESLLHYIQATKLSPSQMRNLSSWYGAKTIKEYLSALDNEELSRLYQYLCGISHPACESIKTFLFLHKGETIVCSDSFDMERALIRDILHIFAPALSQMARSYMGNLVSVFLLLNAFEVESLATSIEYESAFKQTDIWAEVQHYMNESERLYLRGGYEQET